MKKRFWTGIALGAAFCFLTIFAIETIRGANVGSMTEVFRYRLTEAETPGLVKRYELIWTADLVTSSVSYTPSKWLVGKIIGVTFLAHADNVTSGYDVVVNDEDSQDLLQAQGANLTTATTSYRFSTASPVCGPVTLSITNTTGTGEVVLFVE